jgi:hypothetical protein
MPIMAAPAMAYAMAIALPRPRLPPVMKTCLPSIPGLAEALLISGYVSLWMVGVKFVPCHVLAMIVRWSSIDSTHVCGEFAIIHFRCSVV